MSSLVDSQEGENLVVLDLTSLLAVDNPVGQLLGLVLVLAGPLELISPSLVSEPVADKVLVSSVNESGDTLLKQSRNSSVVGLHPVAGKLEVSVDVKVAALVLVDLSTDSSHNLGLVEVLVNVLEILVAQRSARVTLLSDIVDVETSGLVGTQHGVVAVRSGRKTSPDRLRVVTSINQTIASRL